MLQLLLIADNPRLHTIFATECNRSGILLTVASSLDAGVEALAMAKVPLLFVQSRLSGLSGEIIIRHLKAHLPPDAPRIVFLSEGEGDLFSDAPDVTMLNMTLPERQLTSEL